MPAPTTRRSRSTIRARARAQRLSTRPRDADQRWAGSSFDWGLGSGAAGSRIGAFPLGAFGTIPVRGGDVLSDGGAVVALALALALGAPAARASSPTLGSAEAVAV